ncbi:glycosyl transferase [Gemmiger sp. An120]|uniref:DUF2304 domain-containing protein n=1 Tax=Gemmiger sp. An120 TaxID=1965549 RepID=UPI000B37E6EB|nr:DUF2304 domain-containing protein [Gemmiger sp. An120]OUQ42951.1 glycosyl transferase [Gemmiger sp. An120]
MLGISWQIRLVLVLGSLITVAFVLRRVRQARMQIEDSIFWLLFAFFMFILSLVPQVAYWVSNVFRFQSPINVVYLAIIFILFVKQFFMSIQLSQMDSKIRALTQKVALNEEKIEREKDDL